MRPTERTIIHRNHDDNHLVEIIDRGDERSLVFAGNVLQSAMSLKTPHSLSLSYTRYMMAALLLNEQPENVLVVGLGAGSLLHFINYHFPHCLVDGIETSAHIINLCKKYFFLPETPALSIHCLDGYDFLADLPNKKKYDLILVDAFDADGMAATVYRSDFFALCCEHLTSGGIVSLNQWSGNRERLEEVKFDIEAQFESSVELPVPKRGNVICLARNNEPIWPMLKKSRSELTLLSDRFSIDFKAIINVCRKNNLSFFQRLSHRFS
jgi:spermidine synthase